LDEASFEWLENIAHVHRRSVAEELRAAVEEWVEKHRENPRVRATRDLRDPVDEADDEARTSVSSLEDRRRQKPLQSDA
jgi:hypothetical protein